MSLELPRRAFWKRKKQSDVSQDVERDCTLRVFLNDTRCELVVLGKDNAIAGRVERSASDDPLDTKSLLQTALDALTPELERRVGNVEVFLDDPEISVVDSRQAKLSHFEGRSLAEFGKYQLGGKPVCFASHRFGETSNQETEKRIVAYISEDKLAAILFALGKLARFTTFFGPWSLQEILHDEGDDAKAHLSVHGHYSTLSLANGSAGAVAVRHLPVGTATLAAAYAQVYGIENHEASAALGARARFAIGSEFPPPAGAPVTSTGSYMALAPALNRLSGEIAATADYFEFQRLAGRAPALQLSMLGSKVAGFANWLGDMLQVDVTSTDKAERTGILSPALNLLEGMRTGLLKIGNQHFDFVGGRFVPSAGAAGDPNGEAGMASKWKSASSKPVTMETLKPFAVPAAAAAMALMFLVGGYSFVISPIDQANAISANLYGSMLSRLNQGKANIVPAASEPVLWSRDMISVGAAMPYDMKLKRLALLTSPGAAGTTLEISGTLPRDGKDNLQLIGRFITRLTKSAALRRRFSEVTFAGTGQGDSKDEDQSAFKIVAKVAGGTAP
ncbi:MAG: hypothetical protein H0U98_05900 [Alphaproteobacteria bacterium]|nr:hypothetical protein [Alphaproteobacteria bacterium]